MLAGDALIVLAFQTLARNYNSDRHYLIAALTRSEREEEARAQAKELLHRDPVYTLKRTRGNNPFRHDLMIELFPEGLRRAGVPPC